MAYDLRSNPDPATLRGRRSYAVDGRDLLDGAVIRALFSARGPDHAVQMAIKANLIGDLYEVESGDLPSWQRWADSLIPENRLPILPRPGTGSFLGTLEPRRPQPAARRPHPHGAHP